MRADADLLALQREFLAALRVPLEGAGRDATLLPARDSRADAAGHAAFSRTAREHLCPSASLEPVERLDLYRRQYWYRTLDSLAEDFPALRAMLGEEGFWRVAEGYLGTTPSRSFTLRHLGDRVAAFVESRTDLGATLAANAADVAALEYGLCVSFEAAGLEPAALTEMEQGVLSLQPHVQLFALRTPAVAIHRRLLSGEDPGPLPAPDDAAPFHAVVFRDGFRPRVETLEPGAWRILGALREGCTLSEAVDAAGLPDTPDAATTIEGWFAAWTSRRWLVPFPGHSQTAATPRRRPR